MRTRPARLTLLAALAASTLAACGSPETSARPPDVVEMQPAVEDAGGIAPTTSVDGRADLNVEHGMTSIPGDGDTSITTTGIILQNPSPDAAYKVRVVLNYKDASGKVLETRTRSMNYVPAGGRRIVADYLLEEPLSNLQWWRSWPWWEPSDATWE
jgi:hypothetical protein